MKISVSESGVVQLDDLIAAVVKTTKLTPSKAKQKLLAVRPLPPLSPEAAPPLAPGAVPPPPVVLDDDDKALFPPNDRDMRLRNAITLELDEEGTVFLPNEIASVLSAINEQFGAGLEILPHGSGPELWTLENAAAELGKRLGWHRGSIATLQEQMRSAADVGALVIRDPHTDLPCRPPAVCSYYQLARTQDVDQWLASTGVDYRLGGVPRSVPKQRGAANAENILAAIDDLRLRVMGLKRGDKQLVRARLGKKMTPAVFDKTWQRLRSENRIAGP